MSPNANTALSFALGFLAGSITTAVHYGRKFAKLSYSKAKEQTKIVDIHPDIDQYITESIRYDWRENVN